MPKVSIIVPTYNVEQYLVECMESIVNQTLKDIEIICVNDGSTDNSGEILDEYASKDKRIKVIHKENGGYGKAMNVGLDNATGEYIGIVEPDDYVALDMYEKLYKTAKKENLNIVRCNSNIFVGSNEKKQFTLKKNCLPSIYNKIFKPLDFPLIFRYANENQAGIYKREYLQKNDIKHNETPGASFQDIGFAFQIFSNSEEMFFLDEALYNLRRDNPNSSVKDPAKVMCAVYEFQFVEKILKKQHLRKKYIKVFNLKKFYSYKFTLSRIDNSFKEMFVKVFSKEYKNAYKNNELDKNLFTEKEWNEIMLIIKSPKFYCINYLNIPYKSNNFVENIFSIKNEHIRKQHKIITILGLKFKIKRKQVGEYSFTEKIFSVKNRESRDSKWYKVICILGVKFKFKNKELTQRRQLQAIEQRINQVCNSQEHQFKQINNKLNSTTQNIDKQIKETNSNIKNSIQGLNSALEQSNVSMNNSIQNINSLLEQSEKNLNDSVENLSSLIESSNSSTSNTIQALENKIEQLNTEYENKIKSLEMVLLDQQSTQAKILDEKFNKIYNQIRIKKENKALNFKSMQEVTDLIRNNVKILPEDIDLVVGIPRSGIIPAYLIALFLNKNACSLNEFVNNMLPQKGERPINEVANDNRKKHVLIVDDSIYNGIALSKAKEQLKNIDTSIYDISYCAIFAREESKDKVDYYFEIVNPPRMFQWNYLNHANAAVSCYDIDGVLCVDPTPEQNDDGEKYIDFILNAKPLFIPSYEINSLVTSRLEKYRPQTEEWLKKHNIKYKNLYMLDLETAEERRKLGCHAEFKAKIYQEKDDCHFFIESEREQAKKIAEITGKQVICTSTDEYFGS